MTVDIEKVIAGLSPEKRELLLKKLVEKKKTAVSLTIPVHPNGIENLPLSFAQQRLWFLEQLSPEQMIYNLPVLLQLEGELDTAVLAQALNTLVERHQVLRTTFPTVNGNPIQHIAAKLEVALPVVDLTHLPPDERQSEAMRQMVAEMERPFLLATGPLFQATLYRLDNQVHLFFLKTHHIVFDGWSTQVFFRELAHLLTHSTPLPPLPIQYADYALWQQGQEELFARQLAYWKEVFAGPLPKLHLPTDYPRTAVPTFRGISYFYTFSSELSQSLKQLSHQTGATLFMILMAAFQVLLHRYTGQEDILIGFPIANRQYPELENLIGFFVNTLVSRGDLSGNPTFRALLMAVRSQTLAAHDHQDVPFERLVEVLQPDRHQGHPLFQVMFDWQQDSLETTQWNNLVVTPMLLPNKVAQFDLTLAITDTPAALIAEFEYNTALFRADTIHRMVGHFETLLTGIVKNPDAHLSDLPLLTTAETQLLLQWNHTTADFPPTTIHQPFEAQAAKTPNNIALAFESQQLTYRQLNERANQLAHYLRRAGIGPEKLVAICLERSPETAVAILGTLKAGGAYLPLDPAYPPDRQAYMLQDSGANLLITKQGIDDLRLTIDDLTLSIINWDVDWPIIANEPITNPEPAATPDNLAYVIYTSGSTGKPKGVMIQHCGLVNYATAVVQKYALTPQDRVLQFASLSFDVAAEELFPTWLSGATVILRPEAILNSFAEFMAFIVQAQLTVVNLPATFWQEWVNDLVQTEKPLPPPLRLVVVGSEKVSTVHWQRWQQRAGDKVRWINVYGPTEATIGSTFYEPGVEGQAWLEETAVVPIGRPIPNAQVYVLDSYLNPVPVGIPGELYIGGVGLARGYLNRPELTAERFVKFELQMLNAKRDEPFSVYRTGDLARYLPDGALEFLGRADDQVKIRGFRIELGEIEAVLRQHFLVSNAVVMAREDKLGINHLVAYLVLQPSSETKPLEAIQTYLKERLPAYMVPAAFGLLDALPMTPNGKIDRRVLPALEGWHVNESYAAPRTPLEELLAGIWADVLRLEQVGIHSNFFESGGHSLLATQLISRVQTALGVTLPLKTLFAAPTVAELATAVSNHRSNRPITTPILPHEQTVHIPLSFAQQRLWFFEELTPGTPVYNIPSAIHLIGLLNIPALEQSCNEIIRRHEILRTTFTAVDGIPLQTIQTATDLTIPVVPLDRLLLTDQMAAIQSHIREEARTVFDLTNGPLLRFQLLHLGSHEYILLFTTHHIIFDGWSAGIFFDELAALYDAFVKDAPIHLPPLPIQYVDYALWQQDWVKSEAIGQQMAYWKQQLSGQLPVLHLPTDYPRPAIQSYRGFSQPITISAELAGKLRQLGRQQGATLYMTLLAAFNVLLHRYTGQTDLLIGTPVANRNQPGIERLIGFFVNTMVMRTDLAGNPTFADLLKQVRATTLAAYDNQDLPFDHLVAELQPDRNLGYNPVFQAMFALENVVSEVLTLTGVALSYLDVENRTAKFDLTLSLTETATDIVGEIEYSRDLFDALTIKRMAGHLLMLLEGVVANPHSPVDRLPMITAVEQQQLLYDWNPPVEAVVPGLVHQLFEAQVERTPEATAVLCGSQSLTYRQLNEQANQLAHSLRERGVGPETIVGVCMERSVSAAVALLGIWKAGGVYLPLDPTYPEERLNYMVQDSGTAVLLMTTDHRPPTTDLFIAHLPATISIIDLNKIEAQYPITNLVPLATAENLAYIIYTSGSTGRPKGVLIGQGAFASHCQYIAHHYQLGKQDTVLQFSSFSFDTSLEQLATALISGVRVVIRDGEVWSPQQLQESITRHHISVMNLPTAYWHQVLLAWQQGDSSEARQTRSSLRLTMVGGEAMSSESLKLWQQVRTEEERLLNVYGPTETVVTATSFEITPAYLKQMEARTSTAVPIGRPIGDRQLYILDQAHQPVPIGVPGELYIGGPLLAQGYLNRPELTAERFVNIELGILNVERDEPFHVYRTGDLVRYLPDGNIEFLGRADDQVKIRGFRVELGEIEAILRSHTAVQDTIVLLREDTPDDKRLVAYVVMSQTAKTAEILWPYLKDRLPPYMLPTAFIQLDILPLNTNGKVDRQALPVPDEQPASLTKQFVAPHDSIELTLLQIWQHVLKTKNISIADNYFELGGHSLQALTLFAQIETHLGVNLPVASLFQAPTIAGIATIIRQKQAFSSWSSLVAIQPHGSRPPFFCVHGGAGHIFGFRSLAQHLGNGQPLYGLQPKRKADDILAAHSQVEEMAVHYIQEMQTVQPGGPYHLVGYCFGGVVAFEMAHQLQLAGQEVALLVLIDPTAAFSFDAPEFPTEPAEWLTGRIDRHVQSLSQLSTSGKADYMLNSIRHRLKFLNTRWKKARRQLTLRTRRLTIQVLLKAGRPIPRSLRELYFAELVAAPALQQYTLKPYNGRVTLFRADLENYPDPTLGWAKFITGDLDIHGLPADHRGIVHEPTIGAVAEILKTYLGK